jgi:hypothetical protein
MFILLSARYPYTYNKEKHVIFKGTGRQDCALLIFKGTKQDCGRLYQVSFVLDNAKGCRISIYERM